MPVEFDVLKKPDLTYVRLVGDVELGDLLAYIKSYQAHPEYRPGRDELFDLPQWTDTKMGHAEMCAMHRAERTLYPKHPKPAPNAASTPQANCNMAWRASMPA